MTLIKAQITWSNPLNLEEQSEKVKKEVLTKLLTRAAEYAASVSPIDTGAYITSHQITSGGAGRPRGKSSKNKRRTKSEAFRGDALSQLESDISSLDFSRDTFTMRNGSPHAYYVENGGPKWKRPGYKVYAGIRDILGRKS